MKKFFHDRGSVLGRICLQVLETYFLFIRSYKKNKLKLEIKAKELYDKHKHKEMLIKFLTKEISDKSLEYQHSIERNINNSLAYGYKLPYKLKNMLF